MNNNILETGFLLVLTAIRSYFRKMLRVLINLLSHIGFLLSGN